MMNNLNLKTTACEVIRIAEFYTFKDPYYYSDCEPRLEIWRAYKETEKGYWIVPEYDHHTLWVYIRDKKWIPKETRRNGKRFVYPTKEDAIYSYYRRKLEHLRHLEIKHKQLKIIIRKIESGYNIFGIQRPIIEDVRFQLGIRKKGLIPLKKLRPTKEFIEESDFVIL